MKKKFFWLLVLVMMLVAVTCAGAEHNHSWVYTDNGNGTHFQVCTTCGKKGNEEHYRICVAPEGKCSACGAAYHCDVDELRHYKVSVIYISKGDGTHVFYCTDCKDTGVYNCYRYCTDPAGKCVKCGAAYSGAASHSWIYVDNGDGTHTSYCSKCRKNGGSDSHYRYCDDPVGKCRRCGAVYQGEAYHSYDKYVDNGDGTHTSYCTKCGEKDYTTSHSRYCDDPEGKCRLCGASYNGEAHHYYGGGKCVDNGDGTHTYYCGKCGEKLYTDEHYRYCTDPEGECVECGATYNGEASHNWSKCVDNGDGTHTYYCSDCKATEKEAHYRVCVDPAGKCSVCGVAYAGEATHYISSMTYVDNGDGTHTSYCSDCGKTEAEEHYNLCTAQKGKCAACGTAYEGVLKHLLTYNVVKEIQETTHTVYCTHCGVERVMEHLWDEEITQQPTDTTPGLKVKTCSICGYVAKEEIPALKPAADPKYTISGVNYDGSSVTGSVTHVAGTAEADRLYIRVAVFLSNGSYMISVTEVDDDMTFEVGASGDFVYMALVATGTKKSVQPGNWSVLGVYEQEF